jgi:hypothetical protein
MKEIVESIRGEFQRYKALAEGAIDQLTDAELVVSGPGAGNSIATICWHIGGNLRSRFTDFRTSDGEKPWRQREEEFAVRSVSKEELYAHWERGWSALWTAIDGLSDADLPHTVTIRQQPLRIHEALHRSLSHISYHVGQIVYQAKGLRGGRWRYLSIPPGQSATYNAKPRSETPAAQAARIRNQ